MRGNAGELVLDKPLVYSMTLCFLEIVGRTEVTGYRMELKEAELAKLGDTEGKKLAPAVEKFVEKLGSNAGNHTMNEAKLAGLVKDSVRDKANLRTGLYGWTHGVPFDEVKNLNKEYLIELNRSEIRVEKSRMSKWTENCCEGPKELCGECFEKCWFLYGVCGGLVVSTFIIMMSFVGS
jgi:hypothetical protein